MHQQANPICLTVHLSEPIIISGKIFSLKLLSTYDYITFMKRYSKLRKYLVSMGCKCEFCRNMAQKASLISMCLYKNSSNKLFSDPIEVLKNFTPQELKYIYNRYTVLSNQAWKYHMRTFKAFESVKKHRYQGDSLKK